MEFVTKDVSAELSK